MEYCVRLFKRETIDRLVLHYQKVLEEVTEDPGRRIKEIELLSTEERNRLLAEFNATAAYYPQGKTIHQLFEEQAEKTPDSIALVLNNEAMTYRELDMKSNKLAAELMKKGIKAEEVVGIMAERSFGMIIGIFGLRRGASQRTSMIRARHRVFDLPLVFS